MLAIPLELVAFLAIICGIIGRTYFPYLYKRSDAREANVSFKFDATFIFTAIFSGVITAMFVYPLFVIPQNQTMLNVFISAFAFAWGANDVINRLAN